MLGCYVKLSGKQSSMPLELSLSDYSEILCP